MANIERYWVSCTNKEPEATILTREGITNNFQLNLKQYIESVVTESTGGSNILDNVITGVNSLLYTTSNNSLVGLGLGTPGQLLTVSATNTITWADPPTSLSSQTVTYNKDTDVLLVVVAGQSNATGQTGTAVASAANIQIMAKDARVWSNYNNTDSNVKTNIGSNLANPLTKLAAAWQTRVDADGTLPDMYIMNVSKGSTAFEASVGGSDWNPFKIQASSGLFRAAAEGFNNQDTSMFDMLSESIKAGVSEIYKAGKRPVFVGTIWSQWETDGDDLTASLRYLRNLFLLRQMIDRAVGITDSNFFYWKPVSIHNSFTQKTNIVNAYTEFKASSANVFDIDATQHPSFDSGAGTNQGIFIDGIHYTEEVQEWGAEQVLTRVFDSGTTNIPLQVAKMVFNEVDNYGVVFGNTDEVPSIKSFTGDRGDMVYDANYLYFHNGTEWQRIAIDTSW